MVKEFERSTQWLIWHHQIEAKVKAGIYTQTEADDVWMWLHELMNGQRGLYYQGA